MTNQNWVHSRHVNDSGALHHLLKTLPQPVLALAFIQINSPLQAEETPKLKLRI